MNKKLCQRLICLLALFSMQVRAASSAQDEVGIRAYVNDACIVADEPFFVPADAQSSSDQTTKALPLVGIVIGKLTELFLKYVISFTADQVKAGGARKDTRYAMTKEMNLFHADVRPAPNVSLNGKLGCMTIVAGKFKPQTTDCSAAYVPKELLRETMNLPQSEWKTSRTDDSLENQLRRANICLDGKPRAVYEARFEFSEDGTAYRLRNAGYRIDSLLTTQDKGATRNVFYTLEISQPGASSQRETLSTAWVNLGAVAAGARGAESAKDSPPWLRVPSMSVDARRTYEEQTKVHHEVMGEIEALKRAMTRNRRLLTGLDQRIADASPEMAEGLKQEKARIAVQIQAQEAELDARNAEYQDLPAKTLEFMPVSIEVGVTETRSEKKALLALADVMNSNSERIASAGASATSGLVARSLDLGGVPAAPDPGAELERARQNYFDALVEIKTGGANGEAQRNLATVKAKYNEARGKLGLGAVQ